MKILLIGFGGIGRRHFQSLLTVRENIIYIYDINMAFEIPKGYEERVFKIDESFLVKNFSFDLLILATSANVRANILSKILPVLEIKKIIIEKPVAQSIKDLDYLKDTDKKIPTFVNFPLRYYPIYEELKKMNISKDLDISISGGDWGMACNIWHFLDLVSYITEGKLLNVEWYNTSWIPSKRDGFQEIQGQCEAHFSNNTNISLKSTPKKDTPVSIIIKNNNDLDVQINDDYFLYSSIKKFRKDEKVDLYQSELTYRYLEEAIKLPRVKDIYDSTLITLKSMTMLKYNKLNDELILPIT